MKISHLLETLKIETKFQGVQPFKLNWAQQALCDVVDRKIEDQKPVRVIVLKARQIGISTVTEGLIFNWAFLFPRSRGLIIAHEMDSSEHLLNMTNLFWDTSLYKKMYFPKYKSRKHLSWNNESSIRVTTAGNKKAGRGRTIHSLHASEVAFWDDPAMSMLALRQTIPNAPGTFICLESTANGVGDYFWETWNAAIAKENEFVPLFFPWHKHPEYTAEYVGLDYVSLSNLDAEERILRAIGIDDSRLAWRRWAIKNLCRNDIHSFHQEYPSTPDEAFISTGTNVFPVGKLRGIYHPEGGERGYLVRDGANVRFVAGEEGDLVIYRHPNNDTDWGKYFVAGDPTHTTTHDYACIQVINRRTFEQVAMWRGRSDPGTFAEEVAKVGAYYNYAPLTVEVDGPGYYTIGRLVQMDYPHLWRNRFPDKSPGKINDTYGWSTTVKRKEWAVGHLLKLVIDGDLTIHDATTFNEMITFIKHPNGEYGNAQGEGRGHDDTVMALAIASICSSTHGTLTPYGAEDPFQMFREPNTQIQPDWNKWDE